MLKVVFGFLFIAVLSPAERSFLGALEKVVGNGYRIFAKLRLADIVEVSNLEF